MFLSCPSVRVGVRVRVCFPEQCLRCTGDLADTSNQNRQPGHQNAQYKVQRAALLLS